MSLCGVHDVAVIPFSHCSANTESIKLHFFSQQFTFLCGNAGRQPNYLLLLRQPVLSQHKTHHRALARPQNGLQKRRANFALCLHQHTRAACVILRTTNLLALFQAMFAQQIESFITEPAMAASHFTSISSNPSFAC
jgi:hypothetical protein